MTTITTTFNSALGHREIIRALLASAILTAACAGCAKPSPSSDDRPAAPATRPSPPFALRQIDNHWWLLTPDGHRAFSLGVCVIQQENSSAAYDLENPSYAASRHYATPQLWADATLQRLRSWNFTTIGAWSDFAVLRQSSEQTLWLTPILHIGSTAGAPWWDMWDDANVARMHQIARDQILPLRDDPRLIGYYSDNELGWWNGKLWERTFLHPSTSGQRQRLVDLLRKTYSNDWQKLLQDFEPLNASNWKELDQHGQLCLRPGSNGIRVMREFLGILAERYYSLMRQIIRTYDSRALFLGDRYQSFYYPEVARVAARHVDAISTNLNATWIDGTFPRFHLDTLYALTGKPIFVTEIYMCAAENRSGNRNNQGIFPVVPTQMARVQAARTTMAALARLPYTVGIDWFQYADEPMHGRFDAENFNFGLVDIHDRPYEPLVSMFSSFPAMRLKSDPAPLPSDASAGVPAAPADSFADFSPTRALLHWDRQRGFVKPTSKFPLADLYICWNSNALYLAVSTWDRVEREYYASPWIPKEDRALWTVQINDANPVRARIGAGREALVSNPDVRVENLPIATTGIQNIALMELPARVLNRDPFRAGDTIRLKCTLLTHARSDQVEWEGTFTLR